MKVILLLALVICCSAVINAEASNKWVVAASYESSGSCGGNVTIYTLFQVGVCQQVSGNSLMYQEDQEGNFTMLECSNSDCSDCIELSFVPNSCFPGPAFVSSTLLTVSDGFPAKLAPPKLSTILLKYNASDCSGNYTQVFIDPATCAGNLCEDGVAFYCTIPPFFNTSA